MKIGKRFLPLLFLFSFGYSQDWKLSENEYLIKHKGKEYHSKLAERGGSIAYYIYRIDENGEEEITGDDSEEIQDYKDLALASHYNFNKGKILLKINRDLELFRSSNNHYRVGEILNKIVEELSELNATLILNIGNKEFSLAKELYEKYSQEVKGFSKNFMNELIKDKGKIKNLDDLVKKLEEKIFNSTVIEAKKSIKKLENAKKVLLVSHTLSTHEVKLAEKLVSDGTIKGYSTSAFQDEYIRNIDQLGYQLTHVGSSMLKNFPEGERTYDLVKRLGIKGVEEIDSEALRKSFEKMKKIYERVSLSVSLYKENLDPSVEGSSANSLIENILKKLEESLSNSKFITSRGAFTNPNSLGNYSVNIFGYSNSLTFEIKSGLNMLTYGKADLDFNLKKIKKDIEISLDTTPLSFNENISYTIGITDGREVSNSPVIKSYGWYEISNDNRNLEPIKWFIELYRSGKLYIKRSGILLENYPNYYEFDLSGLNKWRLRIVAYTQNCNEVCEGRIKFENIKVKLKSH